MLIGKPVSAVVNNRFKVQTELEASALVICLPYKIFNGSCDVHVLVFGSYNFGEVMNPFTKIWGICMQEWYL